MKISVVTPTYNRGDLLKKLYQSLVDNLEFEGKIEWIIIDDGSTDNTKEIIEGMIKEEKIEIKYKWQENQGKMKAINQAIEEVTGELTIECDSDDYFCKNVFSMIQKDYEKYKNEKDIYGICYLKYDQKGNNMGGDFKKEKTTMFDLYFKEGETGEKAIVFISEIRKKYKHELEKEEKFVTEARMYHKMDLNYKIIGKNEPIMICEYQKDGYTQNIEKQFKENPFGYYQYFKEILQHDMKGTSFKKRIYVIKHYILFTYLTQNKKSRKEIKNISNKMLYLILYFPGILKSKARFNH